MNKSIGLSFAAMVAGAVLSFAAKEVTAAPLLSLTVQPIQICNDGGADCANVGMQLFDAETDKIWAQADIRIDFLGWQTVNSSALLNGNDFGTYASSGNGQILNMYFVESLSDCGGPANPASLFGCGSVDGTGGRVVITDIVFSFNGGIGRLDTIAHEIGHTLGLGHDDFGAGGANNLMTSGGGRTIPSTIDDIFPDGADLDQLTQAQIDEARDSARLVAVPVPEPVPLALIGVGLLAMTLGRRKHG